MERLRRKMMRGGRAMVLKSQAEALAATEKPSRIMAKESGISKPHNPAMVWQKAGISMSLLSLFLLGKEGPQMSCRSL